MVSRINTAICVEQLVLPYALFMGGAYYFYYLFGAEYSVKQEFTYQSCSSSMSSLGFAMITDVGIAVVGTHAAGISALTGTVCYSTVNLLTWIDGEQFFTAKTLIHKCIMVWIGVTLVTAFYMNMDDKINFVIPVTVGVIEMEITMIANCILMKLLPGNRFSRYNSVIY